MRACALREPARQSSCARRRSPRPPRPSTARMSRRPHRPAPPPPRTTRTRSPQPRSPGTTTRAQQHQVARQQVLHPPSRTQRPVIQHAVRAAQRRHRRQWLIVGMVQPLRQHHRNHPRRGAQHTSRAKLSTRRRSNRRHPRAGTPGRPQPLRMTRRSLPAPIRMEPRQRRPRHELHPARGPRAHPDHDDHPPNVINGWIPDSRSGHDRTDGCGGSRVLQNQDRLFVDLGSAVAASVCGAAARCQVRPAAEQRGAAREVCGVGWWLSIRAPPGLCRVPWFSQGHCLPVPARPSMIRVAPGSDRAGLRPGSTGRGPPSAAQRACGSLADPRPRAARPS